MTSPDGITWTAQTAAAANSMDCVTYGNGLFVAVSNGGSNSDDFAGRHHMDGADGGGGERLELRHLRQRPVRGGVGSTARIR